MKVGRAVALGIDIAKSSTEVEFRVALERAVDSMGATFYAALTFDTDDHAKAVHMLADMPTSYFATFHHDVDTDKVDPVMQHCRLMSTPILWDQETYHRAGMSATWEVMAQHGLRQGCSAALHLEAHRHFTLGVEWDRRDALSSDQRARAMADLQTFCIFAEPTAYRIYLAKRDRPAAPDRTLSPRELECLYWVCRGMTDQIVASIIGVSAGTVRKHVDAATAKLGAANRTEAAVIATRLGLPLDSPSKLALPGLRLANLGNPIELPRRKRR